MVINCAKFNLNISIDMFVYTKKKHIAFFPPFCGRFGSHNIYRQHLIRFTTITDGVTIFKAEGNDVNTRFVILFHFVAVSPNKKRKNRRRRNI